jgi:hypothetical protein
MALIDKKLTELTEILSVPDNAFIHVVDPNDVSQSPQGSSYKAKKSTIGGAVKAQVTVSGTVKVDSNNADPIVYLKSKVDALLAEKQNTLVNTSNIASINGQNLLNGGNIEIATNTSLVVTNDATTNRVLSILDANTFIVFSGGNTNLTIPLNANVGFQIGTKIEAFITSAVRLNVLATSGVSIIAPNGLIAVNRSTLLLTKIAVNTWYVNIIPLLFLNPDGGSQYGITVSSVIANFIKTGILQCPIINGDGGATVQLRAEFAGGNNSHWQSNKNIRYTGGIALTQPTELTPKSYVDSIPNPTLNFLPKKAASGFVDSSIFDNGTNVGINQLTPSEKLDVVGNGKFSGLVTASNGTLLAGTGTTNKLAKFTANGTVGDSLIVDNGNSIAAGLGASATGTGSVAIGYFPVASNTFTLALGRSKAIQSNSVSIGNFVESNGVNAVTIGTGLNSANPMINSIANSVMISAGSANPTIVLLQNGNAGINQTNPTERLDVVGNGKFSGTVSCGQFTTATEPSYVKGAQFFNTTLNKMRIGGATAYETVTSS